MEKIRITHKWKRRDFGSLDSRTRENKTKPTNIVFSGNPGMTADSSSGLGSDTVVDSGSGWDSVYEFTAIFKMDANNIDEGSKNEIIRKKS